MEITIEKALEKGIAAHKEGKLQSAERAYRAILQVQPDHPDANHNLGVLAVAVGKPLEAIPLFKLALETNPQIEQFWLSYIDALIKSECFDKAQHVLDAGEKSGVSLEKFDALNQRLKESVPNDMNTAAKGQTISEKRKAQSGPSCAEPSQDQINHLLGHYEAGRFEEAEAFAILLSREYPKHPFGWKVLGVVLQQTGRFAESLDPMQSAVDLCLEDAEAHNNLGVTLQELGRLDKAEASHRQAIALKPDFAEAHYNLGNTLRELGRLDEAEASHRHAIALKPDFAEAHSNLGATLKELRRLEEAEISLEQAIALKPACAKTHNNLGGTLQAMGRLDKAESSYRQAIALQSDYAIAHSNLGTMMRELGRFDEAKASLDRALTIQPDLVEAHRNLALTKHFSSPDEQFCQMQALYHDQSLSDYRRCHICFALAKASEDLERLPDAFRLYTEGNALRKRQLGYQQDQSTELFESLKFHQTQIITNPIKAEAATRECVPIFIVGMPRSGTTLVEQIISSHPEVTGAGELPFVSRYGSSLAVGQTPVNDEVLKTFRGQYLNALQQRSEGNAVVTDKMPQNFHLTGLIATTLPEAKIIHVRRNPAAVCWANFTQYFVGDALGYCYDLEDIFHYHKLYEELMKYWHQVLPGRIYDLHYEALTERQEEETRTLIEHLELEWNDTFLSPQFNARGVATASNVQVRQKVYQGSSERWKRYRPFLNGALDHLGNRRQ